MAKRKKNKLKDTNALGAKYTRNPTPELALELINSFEGFIEKYVTLLAPNKKHGSDRNFGLTSETKDFLRLFASKGDFQSNSLRAYQRVAQRLPNMAVQSLLDTNDVRQSLFAASQTRTHLQILLWHFLFQRHHHPILR